MSHPKIPQDLVPHPRFGDHSVPSGCDIPSELIRSVYVYDHLPVFPDSAIPANTARQNWRFKPRPCYVDILKRCRKCDRNFIFFAREQQYWYEDLGFPLDADCVHCPECRRAHHRLRHTFERFSQAIKRSDLSDEELATLVLDAVFLSESGVLRNEQKLRRLKNLAVKRIPNHEATQAIERRIFDLSAEPDRSA